MSYELLTDRLQELKIDNLKISELYILKVGCVSYSNELEDEEVESTDVTKVSELPFADKIITEVHQALAKHQNVFDINLKEDDKGWEMSTDNHTFISTGNIKLRIEQPARFQKYNDYSNRVTIEKFNVTFNGSTYIAYAPVSDISTLAHIAHEFREICRKQINEQTSFYNNVLGPCPIHPDIYVAFIEPQDAELAANDAIEILKDNEDIIIVVRKKSTIQEIADEILEIIDNDIIDFYRLMSMRSELLSYNESIHNLFSTLSTNVVHRINTPWYNLIKLSRHSKDARNSLALSHIQWSEFEDLQMSQIKQREDFKNSIAENAILQNFSEYLYEHSFHDAELPKSLQTSIGYFEKELHLFSNLKAVISASLLGAILGSLLTGAISLATKTDDTGSSKNNSGEVKHDTTINKKDTTQKIK
jgi:hypothetical protein